MGSTRHSEPRWDGAETASLLLDGEEGAWEDLRRRLVYAAKRQGMALPDCPCDYEELVQDFLACKVAPRQDTFFGRAARGEQPGFAPFLFASLKNHFRDKLRRRKSRSLERLADVPREGPVMRFDEETRTNRAPKWDDDPKRRLLAAMRDLLDLISEAEFAGRTPYRLALLLQMRCCALDMLKTDLPPNASRTLAMAVAPFGVYGAEAFPCSGATLDEAWERAAKAILAGKPAGKACAESVGKAHAAWLKWISRGKDKLRASGDPRAEGQPWLSAKGG